MASSSLTHKIKRIQFCGHPVPIILQDKNGPCALLAICNVLLLKNNLNLEPHVAEISEKLISLVTHRFKYLKRDVDDAIDLLPSLKTEIGVNVKFKGITEFVDTRGECEIFNLLGIPLYHGWIVDPRDRDTYNAIGSKSYDTISIDLAASRTDTVRSEYKIKPSPGSSSVSVSEHNKARTRKGDIEEDAELQEALKMSETEISGQQGALIRKFVEANSTQLTVYGLSRLQEEVKEDELCVFFRNNHFNTMFKHGGKIYLLATDEVFLNQPNLVWEKLDDVTGDTKYMTGSFNEYKAEEDHGYLPSSSDNSSYRDLAITLHESEFEQQPQHNPQKAQMEEEDWEWSHFGQNLIGSLKRQFKVEHERLLVPACKDTKLSMRLYDEGFHYITSLVKSHEDLCNILVTLKAESWKGANRIRWEVKDMKKVQGNNVYFSIVDKDVFRHMSNHDHDAIASYVREVTRLLRPEGRLFCFTPHLHSLENKIMSTPPTIIIEPGINEVPMPMPVSDVATGTSVDGCMAEGQETEPQVPQPRPTRKRGLRSDIWKIFTKDPKNNRIATCNYCKKSYVSEKKNGTSSLWHHVPLCVKNPNRKVDKKQPMLTFEKKKEGTGGTLKAHTFNFEECRKALAEMVIIDEYPFRMVEGQGFVRYTNCLEPRFVLPSRWTVARDCIKVYKDEKKKMKRLIRGRRISMTTDCWTSNQKINYMCLTVHWIDDDWILQKKILNFRQVVSHKGSVLGKVIEKCLLEWGIDNILSLTLDNATSNNDLVKYLAAKTNKWNSCISDNEFLHVRCAAHILNLVVKDGLEEEIASVEAIRNAVKYVRASPARLDTFKRCVEIEKIKSKFLPSMDVDTRWNSTYLMLESSIDFEKAFERLEEEDKGFKAYFEKKTRGPPKKEDWVAARMFVQFLKLFYDCTVMFSSSLSITSNLFFNEMLQVHDMIKWLLSSSTDVTLIKMATEMKVKYDKYWGNYGNINYLLFVCVVLDPRYKMKYVEWNIKRLCDYDLGRCSYIISRVRETLDKLFKYYESTTSGPSTSFMDSRGCAGETEIPSTGLDMYSVLKLERSRAYEDDMMAEESYVNKSELDMYLLERFDTTVKELDVLLWWKVNAQKYPTLSKMARDLLAVPVSTVSSESAFSTGSRVIDNFRTSLLPKTVETLICAQSWLKIPKQPIQLREMLVELEKYEEIAQDLDAAVEAGEDV